VQLAASYVFQDTLRFGFLKSRGNLPTADFAGIFSTPLSFPTNYRYPIAIWNLSEGCEDPIGTFCAKVPIALSRAIAAKMDANGLSFMG